MPDILTTITPYTMMPHSRLRALCNLLSWQGKAGAMVQCGVWNGGSAALMADSLPATHVWLFDSFEGLPAPGSKDGAKAHRKFEAASSDWCRGEEARVREVFRKIEWADERLHITPGWFSSTLATVETGPLTLLHIDADFYDSTMLPLQQFYPLLVKGGLLIVDDYGHWPGAKAACDEYLQGDPGNELHAGDPTRWWLAR
jgi:O-methyltransferase